MIPSRARAIAEELQLLRGKREMVMFHGLSMEPLLQEGDRVVLEEVRFDTIRIGDIITYRHENKYPTRRVVACRRSYVLLWCDNWPALRFRIGHDDILGRVVARVRAGVTLHHTDEAWSKLTEEALHKYRRSHPDDLLRRLRRAIASHILRRKLDLLPG